MTSLPTRHEGWKMSVGYNQVNRSTQHRNVSTVGRSPNRRWRHAAPEI